MQRAFNQMLTGRRGPVALSVPMDIQAASCEAEFDAGEHRAEVPVFAGEEEIKKACGIMKGAKRPVIVAGGGMLYSRAYKQLRELAEYWGAAVITTMAGKGCFPENHYLYGFHGGSKGTAVGNHLCRTADVVLALGCRFADETTSSYRKGITYNFPQTKLIHVDIDPSEIGKNYPCDAGIIGDVAAVIPQLLSALKGSGVDFADIRKEYIDEIRKHKALWLNKLENNITSNDKLTISYFLKAFKELYPKDGYVVTSSGNAQAQLLQEYCFETPGTCITTGGFSTMGFAFPAGIGVKLARPDKKVAAIIGDGDFLMAMQEMSMLAQLGINVTVFVLNNCGWLAIRDLQLDVFGKPYDFGCEFKTPDGEMYSPDFAGAAKSFGIDSLKVFSREELQPAIEKAINSDKPVLVEVMVDTEYPYSGGSATGWWDVPIPAYMKEKREQYLKAVSQEKY
jgi:acetolactate synthase-1/2/3 large subunit